MISMEPSGGLAAETLPESLDSDMISKGQSELDRKVQESLETFLTQTIGKEPFQSFSRSGENPVPWIHWLDAVDQQNVNKLSKIGKVEELHAKERNQEKNIGRDRSSVSNGMEESIHNNRKGTGAIVRGLQSPTDHRHPLKIPQAVVAFAHAAAMANGTPGWPLLGPCKMQMIKCDKCLREFCSSLNYRRHVRMHRRPLNVEKEDLSKESANLAAFWDKLSSDDARQIASLNDIMLQEMQGDSIIKALASFMRHLGLDFLSQKYLKAGASLLDVVQSNSSRFPILAADLFNILDDASEGTFLCTGTSVSVQRFVFEGETRKLGLEVKNLVASVGFLVEQRLVEAWKIDKDAQALRLQKELVEEEEIAQKRQAALLERKRLKKIRHKELKEEDSPDLAYENSNQLLVSTSCDNTSAVVDTPETEEAGHLGYDKTDLEQEHFESSAPECSLNPDQGKEDKCYTEAGLQSGRPVSDFKSLRQLKQLKYKCSNQQTSLKSMRKSNVISKPLPMKRFHEHEVKSLGQRMTSKRIGHPILQKHVSQTMILDSNKAAKFKQRSKDKVVEPVQSLLDANATRIGPTSESSPEIEQKGMTIITVQTGSITDGQKAQQMSTSHSEKPVKRKKRLKGDADANIVGNPVEPMHSLSETSSLGPICQGVHGVKQKGFDFCTAETGNTKDGQNAQQTSISRSQKSASSKKNSKSNTSVNVVVKPVKSMQLLSGTSSSGPTFEDHCKFEQRGLDIVHIEAGSIKDDQNSIVATLGAKGGDDDIGYQSQPNISNDFELLFGSMPASLSNFLGKPLGPMLVEGSNYNVSVTKSTDKSHTYTSKNMGYDSGTILEEACDTEEIQEGFDHDVNDAEKFRTLLSKRWEDAIADTGGAVVLDLDSGVEEEAADTEEIVSPDLNSCAKVPTLDTEADCAVEVVVAGIEADSGLEGPAADAETDRGVGGGVADTVATIVLDSDCGVKDAIDGTRAIGVPDPHFEGEDVISKIQVIGGSDPDLSVKDAAAETETIFVQDHDSGLEDAATETQVTAVLEDPDSGLNGCGPGAFAQVNSQDKGSNDGELTLLAPESGLSISPAVSKANELHTPTSDFTDEAKEDI